MYRRHEERHEATTRDYHEIRETSPTTGATYRSSINPRVTNVQRSRPLAFGGGGGGGGSGVMTRIYQSFQSSGRRSGFGPGLAALANFPGVPIRGSNIGSTALVGLNASRQRDKRELEQLNDKFAQYVEKVRFLEAQNRKLLLELEALRNRSGQGSSRIKEMYDIEMTEAGRLIDSAKKDAAAANIKAQQAEQEVKRQRARYNETAGLRETDRKEADAIERRIAENQAQINLFRRRIADLEDEARRYKAESQRLSSEIARIQHEIQNELFLKSSCDVEKIALQDEIATLKQIHDADLAEIRSRTISTDLDPTKFFRNELSQAIREIRNDYENVVDSQRTDIHNRFQITYNELTMRLQRPDQNPLYNEQQRRQEERVRSEILQTQNRNGYLKATNQDLKNRIDELQRKLHSFREDGSLGQGRVAKDIEEARHRLERANREYNEVTSLKTSLEKEINTYRELLESQSGLRGYVDRIVQNAEQQAFDRSLGVGGGGGGGGGRTDGSTTTIRRTLYTTGSSSTGSGGISNLITQNTRPTSGYETLSSGFRSSFHGSTGGSNITRRN
ncbi:unnamed protein product [Rotaria sordida]|uniref:IF rod domain-containing protein n=1 Tax=Rotaria sordida TaxID=392033 RepID=A0A814UW22_9BILA|nr:unnamed protein product [Rotaria sordida]CAF1219209.1 unnamed protein product [Rotaria sordida]CAF3780573.1 unnamed protein product [Rotaria sordida]CAF3780574.1 unnamed protein product [Rotaria sordida]